MVSFIVSSAYEKLVQVMKCFLVFFFAEFSFSCSLECRKA